MTDTVLSEPANTGSRWNLLQFSLVCCFTVGIHGTTSLPHFSFIHTEVFLIAYYVLLILICIPVCYVQIKLGAIYRRGIVGIFSHLVPILKGSAVAILLMTYIRSLVNGLELSYTLYYMFAAFKNDSLGVRDDNPNYASILFHERFLQRSQHIGQGGHVVWYIALCLLATWTVTYLMTFKGFQGLGKIVYGLIPVGLVLAFVVFMYAFIAGPHQLDIPREFRHYRVIPSKVNTSDVIVEEDPSETRTLSDLAHPKPWVSALLIHMSSVGLWAGILPSLGAQLYNSKKIINASWIILLAIYGTLPVLVMLAFDQFFQAASNSGFIAVANGVKPGLSHLLVGMYAKLRHLPFVAFSVYLISFLFGVVHQAVHLVTIWETLLPVIPLPVMRIVRRRECLVAIACVVSMLISLPFASQAGIFIYMVVNSYVDRLIFTLIIISMVPFITGYIKQECLYLPVERACMSLWYGLSSLVPSAMLIYYFAVYVYPFPVVGYDQRKAETVGWCIAAAPIILGLIFGALHAVFNEKGTLRQRLIHALKTDSLRTTDSTNDYDVSDTTNTGLHPSKPASKTNTLDKTETEVVMKAPDSNTDIAKI
ncbi:sodium-dependent neutral amino acid transporter B(0)AT1-like [Ylistrum balloti]|uniref:sodium-dependent neutral amino acid transporter B(0)AT1-like n=1 Tax=Ylistrum balloti TaxID=509963 RepID=UPI0029057F47|nr:sodium-dependent neutral amino acid transporter B(0)AT1-like [Ylistrum balloti]